MGRFKCRWDRIAAPPEEVKWIRKSFMKPLLTFSIGMMVMGALLTLVLLLIFRDGTTYVIGIGFVIIGMVFMVVYLPVSILMGSGKQHHGLSMYLKEVSMGQAVISVERFLKSRKVPYEKEYPKGWSYRGYLFPPDVAFFIKKELFIGIRFFEGPNKEQLREISIFYLPSIWEEAFFIQRDMDAYYHSIGMALPPEEGKQLVFGS
ncbi:MAG: hypothetical protein ACMUIE_04815 [Thermoplasmatota archaeon]